jgi:hypothetical protein
MKLNFAGRAKGEGWAGEGRGPVTRYLRGPSVDDVLRTMKVVSLRMWTRSAGVCTTAPDSARTDPATARHRVRDGH